jgi:hypothetical protein
MPYNYTSLRYQHVLWFHKHIYNDRDLVYNTLKQCCINDHFIYAMMILTNPHLAFHFEGINIDVDQINHMNNITHDDRIKSMLHVILTRTNNSVDDLTSMSIPPRNIEWNAQFDKEITTGSLSRKLYLMTYIEDICPPATHRFVRNVCECNHVAFAYAILTNAHFVHYYYSHDAYEINKLNNHLRVSSNNLIKDALRCVRDKSMKAQN